MIKVDKDAMYYLATCKHTYGEWVLDLWYDIANRYGIPLDSTQLTALKYCDERSEQLQKMESCDLINLFCYGNGVLTTEQITNRATLSELYTKYKGEKDGTND